MLDFVSFNNFSIGLQKFDTMKINCRIDKKMLHWKKQEYFL